MRAKKLFALLLAGTMMMGVLTGCWCKPDDESSSGTDGDSDITWTDPDYDEDEDAPVAEYTIAVDVGDYGTVKPASPIKVKAGDTATFTVTANEGWLISGIQIDNKDQPSSGPVETLKVSLDKVSANHTVTVKYEAKTFTVSAAVNGGNGTVSPAEATVVYGGTASITVVPNTYYEVEKVTATMNDGDVEVEGSDNGPYTVADVKGNVVFTVTFRKATITDVKINEGGLSKTEYKAGEMFELGDLTATITYSNGNTKQVSLSDSGSGIEGNVTIEPKEIAADTEKVTVTYEVGDQSDSKTYDVTVTYLSQADNAQINEKFEYFASTYNVPVVADQGLIDWLKSGDVNHKEGYKYEKLFFNLKNEEQEEQRVVWIEKEMSSFFMNNVNEKKDQYKDVRVYWYMNEDTGNFTMYVIFKN